MTLMRTRGDDLSADFYEEDEPIVGIVEAFERGPKFETRPPLLMTSSLDMNSQSRSVSFTVVDC